MSAIALISGSRQILDTSIAHGHVPRWVAGATCKLSWLEREETWIAALVESRINSDHRAAVFGSS